MKTKYKQGIYKPQNPEKWVSTQIVYRSSWEYIFSKWADLNPNVTKVASEEIIIPYFLETDQKMHRYYPDYLLEFKDKNDIIRTVLIEVKPYNETKPPIKGRKSDKRFINESLTYEKNVAKWKAAKAWCKEKNIEFMIITEYELGIKSKK